MDFNAGFLANMDMSCQLFAGQDDFFLSPEEGEKRLVGSVSTKFDECSTSIIDDGSLEVTFQGSLFDSEWMTTKLDLSVAFAEQLDGNLNVNVSAESQSAAIVVATDIDDPSTVDADVENIGDLDSNDVMKCVFDEQVPVSPEQHVPDVDSSFDNQFQVLLDSILSSSDGDDSQSNVMPKGDDEVINEAESGARLSAKRKIVESTLLEPKTKVRTPEQKQRKRLQNRNAATRYRSKKRSEQEILNAKCAELEDENAELQEKIESLKLETSYMKQLIMDVFNKKHAI